MHEYVVASGIVGSVARFSGGLRQALLRAGLAV
jgi:hypothetical protein